MPRRGAPRNDNDGGLVARKVLRGFLFCGADGGAGARVRGLIKVWGRGCDDKTEKRRVR